MVELRSESGFLDVQGAPLYYAVTGQGQPLLLIHAGIADSRMWDEQVPVFAPQYQVIRYDLRGFGKSQFPAGSFASYEDPAALLRYLHIEKAHVVGVSFGGKVAVDFALVHPEMVNSLVLVAPSIGGAPSSEAVKGFNEEEEMHLERGDLEAATDLNVRFWVDGPRRTPDQVNPEVRRRVYEMQYHAFTVPIPAEAEEVVLEPPAIKRLAEIRVPTLIIVGDCDQPDKIALAQRLAAEIPQARLEIIKGAAHMVSMEQPEAFNRLVQDFLNLHRK
ncbi:MAG TPA: alpha/beta hydrolase [Ktedonobacteraceae bacterium]|nr:alpha/beta hydrolase [Ktedonobacteraceae bacterium]